MKDDNRMLDCGHSPSPHNECSTGTAHTQDGREICWSCADKEQVEEMRTKTEFIAYLSSDRSKLTTWSGGKLALVTAYWKVRNNFAGHIYRFRAIDSHKQKWFGTTPGPGMYARMHKCKNQAD